MAPVSVAFLSRSSGHIPHSRFDSTSTGSALMCSITEGTAWKVKAFERILSPGLTPAIFIAMNIVEPHEFPPTACLTPMNSANFFSKFAVIDSSFDLGW